MLGFSGTFQDPADAAAERNAQVVQHLSRTSSPYIPDPVTMGGYLNNPSAHANCDIKPRLTKEQHDVLEAHYQKQNKPSTVTKKGFAESLNVSLEKVNNWFQNRRAKSKQETKKNASATQTLNAHQTSSSDTDVSPGYVDPSSDYNDLFLQWSAEEHGTNGLGLSQTQSAPEHLNGLPFVDSDPSFLMPQQFQQQSYMSQLELNRRTLTQEQFDAMGHNVDMSNGSTGFDQYLPRFVAEQPFYHQVFAELPSDLKQQDAFAFPHPIGAPLSSNDSTVPSISSEQSLSNFPTSSNMQDPLGMSGSISDWSESRNSSIQDGNLTNMHAPHQHSADHTAQWQPGQSEPVDFNAYDEHFRQIDQARPSPTQAFPSEQPLAWPADSAFGRRDSQTSLLAQSMSSVGIQTPHPQHSATFKSPAPPSTSTLAARRQRPKPANLGLAALRSQSHSGAVPPISPQHFQQPLSANPEQQLRRIKSSIGVAGRITKQTPGSAQRSPLNWSFADALNSPHANRHVSAQGNLAPPTPLSPRENLKFEQPNQRQTWQTAPGSIARHASVSETDLFHPSGPPTGQNFSSPPHTPMYFPQQFVPPRFGSSFMTENTPPQSAPASQSCFPANVFSLPPQPHPQVPMQQHMPPAAMSQQQFAFAAVPDQQFPMSNFTFAPNQQVNIPTSGPPPGVPLQFSNGTPVINAEGQYELAFSAPQIQYAPASQMQAMPPPVFYPYCIQGGSSPTGQGNAQPSKPAPEFFVHEYNPPESVKAASTPPRSVDTGPKNYTFSHVGPETYADKKQRKADREAGVSSSPASSIGTASTS